MTIHEEFEQWWKQYPHRVAKFPAFKAFQKARVVATFDELVVGLKNYVAHKPAYAEWAHGASWLNAGRWTDEYDAPVVQPVKVDWFDECKAIHDGACIGDRWKHHLRKQMESQKERAS